MKSYGDKWGKSRVKVTILEAKQRSNSNDNNNNNKGKSNNNNNNNALEFHNIPFREQTMEGFHDKKMSEMYTEEMELNELIYPPSMLQIRLQLISGTTFKVMGLAVCGD